MTTSLPAPLVMELMTNSFICSLNDLTNMRNMTVVMNMMPILWLLNLCESKFLRIMD